MNIDHKTHTATLDDTDREILKDAANIIQDVSPYIDKERLWRALPAVIPTELNGGFISRLVLAVERSVRPVETT